jgi:hypothetical protein
MMDRRKFISKSAKQLALINLAGVAATSSLNASPYLNKNNKLISGNPEDLVTRILGRTGIRLPVVNMGVMNANNPGLVRAAWEAGMRLFDTAWVYQNGNNEKMVGQVLRELNVRRGDVIIATKILLPDPAPSKGRERKKMFLDRFDESLSRLQMDYVDILYYHDIQSLAQLNDRFIRDAFDELKAKKKIRFTGFSTHSDWPPIVADAARRGFYDVILLSFNYGMYSDQRIFEAMKQAHSAGIGLVAMKTQCQQDWYLKSLPVEQTRYSEGALMNTALLKWALRCEYITTAVPGFTNFTQMNEDIGVAYDLDYTKEEEEFLNNRQVKQAIGSVCRHCGSCVASCHQKADIPSLMRTHMYTLSYGNPLAARQTLSRIPQGKGLEACMECSACTGTCRAMVPIADRIKELREIYT